MAILWESYGYHMVRVGRGQVNGRDFIVSGSLAHLRLSTETAEEFLYLSFSNLSLLITCSRFFFLGHFSGYRQGTSRVQAKIRIVGEVACIYFV